MKEFYAFSELSENQKHEFFAFCEQKKLIPVSDRIAYLQGKLFSGGKYFFIGYKQGKIVFMVGAIVCEADRGEIFLTDLYQVSPDCTGYLIRAIKQLNDFSDCRIRIGIRENNQNCLEELKLLGFFKTYSLILMELDENIVFTNEELGDFDFVNLNEENFDSFIQTHNQGFKNTPNAATYNTDDARTIFLDNSCIAGILLHNKEIIGTIELRIENDNGSIEGICLLPQCRGRGFGHALLKWAVLLLKEKKCKKIGLSVMDINTKAYTLYEKSGFRSVQVFSTWYELDFDRFASYLSTIFA